MKDREKRLMQAYLDGDSSAFSQIYETYSPAIYRYLLRKLRGQSQDAQEILQNTFLKFHNLRDRYQEKYPLLQWLYVMARSELHDFFRKTLSQQRLDKKWAHEQDLSQTPVPAPLIEVIEEWNVLLSELSPESREVILNRALREESFEEMSERLAKSSDSLRQIFSRSRKKLEQRILRLKGEPSD